MVLFDAELLALPSDPRSVGEILHDLDRQARDLLFDADAEDAAGLLRAWPEYVSASVRLWNALPGRPIDPAAGAAIDRPLNRLVALSESIDLAIQHRIWPGPGPGDGRMTEHSRWVDHATQLVSRYAGEVSAERAGPRGDIDAARVGIIHSTYVMTHAVMVALNRRRRVLERVGRDQGWADPGDGRLGRDLEANARGWLSRLNVCEGALLTPASGGHPLLSQLTESSVQQPDPVRSSRAWRSGICSAIARSPVTRRQQIFT